MRHPDVVERLDIYCRQRIDQEVCFEAAALTLCPIEEGHGVDPHVDDQNCSELTECLLVHRMVDVNGTVMKIGFSCNMKKAIWDAQQRREVGLEMSRDLLFHLHQSSRSTWPGVSSGDFYNCAVAGRGMCVSFKRTANRLGDGSEQLQLCSATLLSEVGCSKTSRFYSSLVCGLDYFSQEIGRDAINIQDAVALCSCLCIFSSLEPIIQPMLTGKLCRHLSPAAICSTWHSNGFCLTQTSQVTP